MSLPIIFRTLSVLLTAAAAGTVTPAAYSASRYAASSALSQGRWVKIRVTGEPGMRQVTYDELRQWGFSNPEHVVVCGYGGVIPAENGFPESYPDDVPYTQCHHTADGRILFYAEADTRLTVESSSAAVITRSYHDRAGYYFLTESESQTALPPIGSGTSSQTPLRAHYHGAMIEREVQNPGSNGAIFHGPRLGPGQSEEFSYSVRDFDRSASPSNDATGCFRYQFAAKNRSSITMSIAVPPQANASQVRNMSCPALRDTPRLYNLNYGYARFTPRPNAAGTTYTFAVKVPESAGNPDYVAIDYTYLIYPRTNRLGEEPYLVMNFISDTDAGRPFTVAGANSDIQIWDVTDPARIRRYQTSFDASASAATASLQSGRGCVVAFDPSREMPGVELAGVIPNQNIHSAPVPEMAVITTRTLAPFARELAEIHRRTDGLEVEVFVQDDIFNEFSSGARSAAAYRRMAKMFYDRDPQRFKYVLLYGCSVWDNRFITEEPRDVLMCFPAEDPEVVRDPNKCYTADQYFGMLSDDYDKSHPELQKTSVAVGRISAPDGAKAAAVNRKIEKFLKNPPSPAVYLRAMMLSDDGDGNKHLIQSEEAISVLQKSNPAITATRAHDLLYPWTNNIAATARNIITRGLTRGQGYFSYSGHGNATYLSSSRIWTDLLAESTTYASPGFAMLSTCDTYPFQHASNSISEAMLFNEDGGMIGVVSSCGPVFLEYNQAINIPVAREYASATPGTTYGQLLARARNKAIDAGLEADRGLNTMFYNHLGDPSLPIPAPSYSVVVDKINGETPSGDRSCKISPLQQVKIEAHVADASGNVITAFNGSGLIEIYDGPESLRTTVKEGRDTTMTVTTDEKLLTSKGVAITGGRISTELYIPAPSVSDAVNRLVISGSDSGTGNGAAGICRAISVGGSGSSGDADNTAPAILEFYIGSPSFSNGDVVNTDITVEAIVYPSPSGLNTSQNGIGTGTALILDGNQSYPEFAHSAVHGADGNIRFSLPLKSLSTGRHCLTLSVANNAGLRAAADIHFVADGNSATATLTAGATVARERVSIGMDHSPAADPECSLTITDAEGRTVFSRGNVTFPFEWDLTDRSGKPVPDGRYRAFAIFRSDRIYGSTPAIEIVVIR